MSEREGRLTVDGDRAVLNFERRLPFPVEVVWSAITDPDEREQWFGETTIEAREGGTIDMVATGPPLPPERKRMTGRILVWDPPHVLEHEWKQPIVEDGVVRYELHRRRRRHAASLHATAASASATRAGSSAAPTRSWTAWRPTSPATSCQTGRHVGWK